MKKIYGRTLWMVLSLFCFVLIFSESCMKKPLSSEIKPGYSGSEFSQKSHPSTTLNRILRKLALPENIAYNPPQTMMKGLAQKVDLRLTVAAQLEKYKKQIADGALNGEVGGAKDVTVLDLMEADLDGNGAFNITPPGVVEQTVSPQSNLWTWMVTPLQEGDHRLTLKLSIILQKKNKNEPRVLKIFDNVVTVVAPPPPPFPHKVMEFLSNNWLWICLLLLIPLVGFLLENKAKTKKR